MVVKAGSPVVLCTCQNLVNVAQQYSRMWNVRDFRCVGSRTYIGLRGPHRSVSLKMRIEDAFILAGLT